MEPMLNSAMKKHPRGQVRIYTEEGKLTMGTTCSGYLSEQADLIAFATSSEGRLERLTDLLHEAFAHLGRTQVGDASEEMAKFLLKNGVTVLPTYLKKEDTNVSVPSPVPSL
jgi:hypothetical protein